jgi:hypothetical membrane protein
MTSIEITRDEGRSRGNSIGAHRRASRALLASGALASLLYVTTDIIGGLRYPGYSFTSQAISELGAIGAPSKPFVDALFLLYDLLALTFAIVVLREARRHRPLRLTGAFLASHAILGVLASASDRIGWLPSFSMQQRGVGSLATDWPHIALTGGIALFLILAISCGAFALGRRFRVFSFVVLAAFVVFGAITGRFGALLAAGEPTPGLGIIERIDVYSSMLWMALLSSALMRHAR